MSNAMLTSSLCVLITVILVRLTRAADDVFHELPHQIPRLSWT